MVSGILIIFVINFLFSWYQHLYECQAFEFLVLLWYKKCDRFFFFTLCDNQKDISKKKGNYLSMAALQ